MTINAILSKNKRTVETTSSDTALFDAAHMLTVRRIGLLVVCNANDKILGVLSERDIVHGVAKFGPGVVDKSIADLMTTDVVTCSPNDLIGSVLQTMSERQIRHVPVVHDGALMGMVSIRDLALHLLENDAETVKNLLISTYRY